jgi:hypothetical protein
MTKKKLPIHGHNSGHGMGHPVPGPYANTETWLSRLGGVSNLRQQNKIMIPAGLGPETDCAREAQL